MPGEERSDSRINVRPARPGEESALHELAMRSKAHWGYSEDFMAQCVEALSVERSAVDAGWVLVAEDGEEFLGMMGWEPAIAGESAKGADWDISHLFVEPAAMGRGVGGALFREGMRRIRELGGIAVSILADPGARPFYERMGAELVGDAPSDAIPGRRLPLLIYRL